MSITVNGNATRTLIRPGGEDDLDELTRIYNHYVTGTPVTFDTEPFTPEQRRGWLTSHPAHGPHRLLVAEEDGALLGYATSSPFRPKAAYATSVETSVYLAPEHVGRGVGGLLYQALFTALADEDVHQALAGVTVPNEASERLHRRFGFQPCGVHREVGRKFGRFWDVAWFQRPVGR
ncbi:GNAT family N-acetyltransferase [Streptantibioticus cattleyicolor]|uniref:Phosphinothricin acetyltransferase n=1 Tax=Streptantibioticus cattleyicolor (strain ATCC 35852 / DSM 46488 / JCM 4925 / NBRC 14057 / NRRL 8057) TaxID=1003195 RepID=F8JMX8_STREN|nr:GNAT family N-acetyltransferase [Streptantibioticus cattleyicolor]AEW98612.1 phosphinothricin acetyltransferase [Streptantibioticus cattleyicolor NRRL 8057 = DSM 46488]CCB72329.1 Phosphinothricin N-acetyltransferase [Streptantibioticus cattleyicolor NRRL 8057 = DSM 46488]